MDTDSTVRRYFMFNLDSRSETPLFEQIYQQVRRFIGLGIFEPEHQLPTVRTLARELGVNPSTISKAYSLCENNSLIYSVPGSGYFVSNEKDSMETVKKELYEVFYDKYVSLIEIGESPDAILSYIKEKNHDSTH